MTVNGTFAFKKANDTFYLDEAGSSSFTDDYLAISGNVASAFVGVGALGLTLNDVDFGVLLVTDTVSTFSYSAVSATVDNATFAGIPGLTATVSAASFRMNQTSNPLSNAVLDFAGAGHEFGFAGTALTLTMSHTEGGLIEA